MWARQVSFELIGRDKLEYVNGEFTMPVPTIMGEPTEDEKKAIREWRKSDNRVAAWLLATMEPHISKIMTYQEITKQMWDKAERLYGKRKNHSHVYRLQQELYQIKQQPNQSVSQIFSLLQEKIDDLKLYRPPTIDQRRSKREKSMMKYFNS
jgi:gag-polypeptide of LTR copia-type